MLRWLKRLAVPVTAVAMFSSVPLAKADQIVSYYTIGLFNGHTASFTSGDTQSDSIVLPLDLSGHAITLKYSNVNSNSVGDTSVSLHDNGVSTFSNTNFGNFTWTGDNGSFNVASGFTLEFVQTNPLVAGGDPMILGTILGNISITSGVDGSTAEVYFHPTQVFVSPSNPEFLYSLQDLQPDGGLDISNGGSITGRITAVPLPATASTGLALLGGLGLLGGVSVLRRRRQMA